MSKYRILVVDDEHEIADQIESYLSELDAVIEKAHSEREARERLRCKTYHLAIFDIQLVPDNSQHEGGIRLMQYVFDLNEGTRYCALSKEQEIMRAIEALRLNVWNWFGKSEIRCREDLAGPVAEVLPTCKLRLLGNFKTLTSYLAHPELIRHWEPRAMATLGGVGFNVFNDTLNGLLRPLLPVLRLKDGTPAVQFDEDARSLSGLVWSKGVGDAAWFGICRGTDIALPVDVELGGRIARVEKGGCCGEVHTVLGAPRERFYERLCDLEDIAGGDHANRGNRER